jgi:hypothetical protein
MRIFQKKLTKDLAKKSKAQTTTSLDDVHETVEAAHAKYEDPGNQSKARERLRRFSGTLLYYGNIMDVLVQHHPEYVSLVWGAMKFLFVVSLHLVLSFAHIIDYQRDLGLYEPRSNNICVGQGSMQDRG